MKTLILMRHAQATPYAETDRLRPLTEQGREQATQSAQQIQQQGECPQLIVCSPYVRAQQTARLVGEVLNLTPKADNMLDGRLSAGGLLNWAQGFFDLYDSVLLIGHNPNISLAAALLSGEYISLSAGDFIIFHIKEKETHKEEK